jgi:hypothetical protein
VEDETLQSRADTLAACVQALAAALYANDVPEETSTRLLAHASAAVLNALVLEALLEQAEGPAAAEREPPAERTFRLAA